MEKIKSKCICCGKEVDIFDEDVLTLGENDETFYAHYFCMLEILSDPPDRESEEEED